MNFLSIFKEICSWYRGLSLLKERGSQVEYLSKVFHLVATLIIADMRAYLLSTEPPPEKTSKRKLSLFFSSVSLQIMKIQFVRDLRSRDCWNINHEDTTYRLGKSINEVAPKFRVGYVLKHELYCSDHSAVIALSNLSAEELTDASVLLLAEA